MALDADTLLDRMQLKQQVTRWRTLALLIFCVGLIIIFGHHKDISPIASDHIARVTIEGVIIDDPKQQEMLEKIRENKHVKAVLVRLDTPGGTAVGGEELYLQLRKISETKPVVILMRTLCTSAGYMAALGGDYILAREGSITGSIGVIMQTAEFTNLAEKIGVTPITIKSGPNKASPNPLEKFDAAQREVIERVVDDFYRFFVTLVSERRKLSSSEVAALADGRIFTGAQALNAKLIDALGGEKEALEWLAKERQLSRNLDIHDVKPEKEDDSLFGEFGELANQALFSLKNLQLPLDGLVLIWQPTGH
jgi:protease-4